MFNGFDHESAKLRVTNAPLLYVSPPLLLLLTFINVGRLDTEIDPIVDNFMPSE